MRYLIERKGRLFVPGMIASQSPIVNVKMDTIDWLKMSPGEMSAHWFRRNIGAWQIGSVLD